MLANYFNKQPRQHKDIPLIARAHVDTRVALCLSALGTVNRLNLTMAIIHWPTGHDSNGNNNWSHLSRSATESSAREMRHTSDKIAADCWMSSSSNVPIWLCCQLQSRLASRLLACLPARAKQGSDNFRAEQMVSPARRAAPTRFLCAPRARQARSSCANQVRLAPNLAGSGIKCVARATH